MGTPPAEIATQGPLRAAGPAPSRHDEVLQKFGFAQPFIQIYARPKLEQHTARAASYCERRHQSTTVTVSMGHSKERTHIKRNS